MRSFFFLCFLVSGMCTGQNIEMSTHFGKNNFYKLYNEYSGFTSGLANAINIAVSDIETNWSKVRLELGLVSYSGKYRYNYVGKAGNSTRLSGEIMNTDICFTFYPLSIQFWKKFEFDLGVRIAKNVDENFAVTIKSTSVNTTTNQLESEEKTLNEKFSSISIKALKIGVSSRLAYNITLGENWSIQPQLTYFLGLSEELYGSPSKMKSMRYYAGIGIRRSLSFD